MFKNPAYYFSGPSRLEVPLFCLNGKNLRVPDITILPVSSSYGFHKTVKTSCNSTSIPRGTSSDLSQQHIAGSDSSEPALQDPAAISGGGTGWL